MSIVLGLLGCACIAYGVTIMLVWSGSNFFMVWYAIGAALLGLAWMVHSGLWAALPVWVRRIAEAFGLAAAALVVGLSILICTTSVASPPKGLDTIIVLGAQIKPAGNPSSVLQYRLDAAISYLEGNPETKVIVSGGQGPNEPCTEAEGMATYLQDHGIAPNRIILEDKSENTAQNIEFSKALLANKQAPVGIVTNNFHVWRATALARKQGLDAYGISAPSVPWYLPNNVLRECMGIVKDFLVGNI